MSWERWFGWLPRRRDVEKFLSSLVGRPWIFVDVVPMPDGRARLELDYNMAFIRYLDKHGFDTFDDDDEKVDAYLRRVVGTTMVEVEEEEEEEE